MGRTRTQPPLFPVECVVCHFDRIGEHQPWCPQFLRGAAEGGDPAEWPSLFDDRPERANRKPCEWCNGAADPGSTCPRSLTCPTCAAPPGGPCKRPSGHRAAELHAERVRAAEAQPPSVPDPERPTYRERRAARAKRLRGWAEKRETKAEAAFTHSHDLAEMIPFGQPVLAGHHSQRRHERHIEKIRATSARGVEHAEKARSMSSRADTIEAQAARSIYNDDPHAAEQLAARVERLEAERARVVAFNKTARAGHADPSILDERQRANLASAISVGMGGPRGTMPAYVLANLGGNISRQKKRLARMQAVRP